MLIFFGRRSGLCQDTTGVGEEVTGRAEEAGQVAATMDGAGTGSSVGVGVTIPRARAVPVSNVWLFSFLLSIHV